jgi:predicted lipid-binding transport protein (Tim44 family)
MPQPKSSRSSSSRPAASRARKPAASRSAAAKKPAAASAASRSKAAKRPAASARKPAAASARKPAAATARKPAAKRSTAKSNGTATRATTRAAATAAASTEHAAHANLTALRDILRRGVVLTTEGLKSALDDAVTRGRLTRKDATELSKALLSTGRSQADGFRADLEHVVGKGRSRAAQSSDRVLREVDRARRNVGVGPSFPISLYDELNASQIQQRLGDLTRAQIRKVRDHERRNANRKSVLGAIEKKLG